MTRQKVRVGVIGGGVWGEHHLTASRQMEAEGMAELVCVGAYSKETAEKQSKAFGIQGYTDYKELIQLEGLDLVIVCTPDHLHREMTLYALEHDCHVLVEKPLDLNSAGCQDMIDLAQKKKRLLMVDFHKRYDPYVIEIKHRIAKGEIGDLYYGHLYMEDKISVPLNNLRKWAEESSPFWFIGVHKADLLRWVTGQEVTQVLAHGYRGRLEQEGIDALDAVSAHILMDGGFSCTIDVSWVIPNNFEALVNQGVRIVGSKGLIEADTQDRGLRFCSEEGGMQTANKFAYHSYQTPQGYKAVSGYYVDPTKDFIRKCNFVLNGGDITKVVGTFPSGFDGMAATQVAEAVAESISNGGVVQVEPLEKYGR
jgi:predicted dehydrogenase